MKRRMNRLSSVAWVGVVTALGCSDSPPCTDEQAETRDTAECTNEVELVTYTAKADDAVTLTEAWESGDDVRLEGAVREITVVEGESAEVVITYRAQADLADGRSESFVRDRFDELEVEFERRGETLRLDVTHPRTSVELGAVVTLALPPDFDGDLSIQKYGAPGNVTIEHLGRARVLDVDMEQPDSDLLVEDNGSLRRVRLNAAGSVETVAFDDANLEQVVINSEEGDIVTAFDVVPESHATLLTGKIQGDSVKDTGGNIRVGLPVSGDFTAATFTKDQARFEDLSSCDRFEIADDIQKLVCGSGDRDEMLTFEITSSSNITVQGR